MPIENLHKGALPDPPDSRDYQAEPLMGAVQVDFSKEFRLPNPGNEDQGSSLSCVAQAGSYYHTQIHPADYSRRDLYSRIHLPQGGAYIRDGVKAIVDAGQATRDEVPDPQPETEAGMTAGSGTPAQEGSHQELSYFVLPQQDINGVAWGIQNYKGVIFGVTGSNPGWQDLMNPRPPQAGEQTWGHALYAMGYHTHQDGQKCIIAKSSWCSEVLEHHIRENYFITGNTFSAWTLISKGQIMTQFKTQNYKGELRIVLQASTPEQWTALCAVYGVDPAHIDEQV